MKEIIAKCGYRCDLCPAYTENIKSEEDKKTVSEGWKRVFGFEVPPDEVECVGCHNKGKKADAGCPVRPCAVKRGLESCAYCENFDCDSLKTRTGFLNEYMKIHGNEVSEKDIECYIRPYESKDRLLYMKTQFESNK
jgi:hypothetical protein